MNATAWSAVLCLTLAANAAAPRTTATGWPGHHQADREFFKRAAVVAFSG